ncbi:S8 family peptidase [Bacillus marinisedimentorum]|uniref:S8 family peptidase n=1 Tax=Bacillus marinisedimentorum TaxID=1821260 RepID=UPI000872DA99|nr:S8 family peptidase [Bacillus marinisedimentorum]
MENKYVSLIPVHVHEVYEKTDKTPYGIEMLEAPKVWDASNRGERTVIAVLDTGCDTNHPDLKDRIIDGRNFTDDFGAEPDHFEDNNGHGTHVSGTIAASLNGEGVAGMAPEASILAVKVLSGKGSGRYDWIINGIKYAVDWRGPNGEKARVISMSLGGSEDYPELHKAIQKAVQSGILVVCAAGNSGDGSHDSPEYAYPGAYPEVVQVGAVDKDMKPAPFSNTNAHIDLVAPGVKVVSTYPDGKYASLSGTSMAAPHISGAAALLITELEKRMKRELTEAEIYAQLCKHATALGYEPAFEGYGLPRLHSSRQCYSGLLNQPDTITTAQ